MEKKILLIEAALSYVLLCQPVHFNTDKSVESVGKDKTGYEDEDLESRLPKT